MNMCSMIRKHFLIIIAVRGRCEHPTHFTERKIEPMKGNFSIGYKSSKQQYLELKPISQASELLL